MDIGTLTESLRGGLESILDPLRDALSSPSKISALLQNALSHPPYLIATLCITLLTLLFLVESIGKGTPEQKRHTSEAVQRAKEAGASMGPRLQREGLGIENDGRTTDHG